MLKSKDYIIKEVEYRDFDDFIEEVYGHKFNFVADQECSNDSEHTFEVVKAELDEYDEEELENFKFHAKYERLTYILLTDLVNRDLIVPGMYLISVSW